MYQFNPSRSDVIQVKCPRCHSPADKPCTGIRGKVRESNHQERVQRFTYEYLIKRGLYQGDQLAGKTDPTHEVFGYEGQARQDHHRRLQDERRRNGL